MCHLVYRIYGSIGEQLQQLASSAVVLHWQESSVMEDKSF